MSCFTEDKGLPVESDSERNLRDIKEPSSGLDPADFPDGGLKAWSVVLGGWCCLFTSFGWINVIGIFQNYYQGHQLSDYPPSTVAWIPSTEVCHRSGIPATAADESSQTFMMYFLVPMYGKIFDTFGPRPLLYFGIFAHVLGLMMTSLSSEYYQFFLAQSVCSAAGASALFYAGTNPVGTWFLKRRALAFGIVSAGSSLSGCLVP